MRIWSQVLLLCTLSVLVFTTGCENIFFSYTKPVTIPSAPISYLAYGYVSTYANEVEAYTISPAGLWSPIPNGVAAAGTEPAAVAIDSSNRFLYAANVLDNSISEYFIDPLTGVLRSDQPATVSTGTQRPENLSIDHSGKFLYVPGDGYLLMYRIDQVSGVLTPNSPATVGAIGASGAEPRSMVIDPMNHYLYANTGSEVLVFSLDSTSGLLTQIGSLFYGGGRGFVPVIDPRGRFIYLVDEFHDELHIFSIDPLSGLLTVANPAMVPVGRGPSSLDIDPTGRYLYVENRSESTVSQFNVHADGSVTPMIPAKIQQGGYRIIVDPSGQLAYVGAAGVIVYRINATGGLEYYSTANSGTGIGIAVARHQ